MGHDAQPRGRGGLALAFINVTTGVGGSCEARRQALERETRAAAEAERRRAAGRRREAEAPLDLALLAERAAGTALAGPR